jgi:hypothetical protein
LWNIGKCFKMSCRWTIYVVHSRSHYSVVKWWRCEVVTLTTRDQVKGSNFIFKLGLVEGFIYIAKQYSWIEVMQITNYKQKDDK